MDELQRRHRSLAFVWAVQKKFNDDRGGYLCALIAYYGFLSVFPLLLAAFTIAAYALSGNSSAIHTLEHHIGSYPIVGSAAAQLEGKSLQGSPVALLVGVLGLIWGAQGLAQAAQFTMDEVWNVPDRIRPGFASRLVRSLGWYGTFAIGALITTFISSLGSVLHWSGGPILSTLLAVAVDVGLFLTSFWILTPPGVAVKELVPGAVMAGAAWAILTGVGIGLVHMLAHSNSLYGTFAPVLGLLAFIYLMARVSILSIEVNAVLAGHLWPRSLDNSDLTEADRRQLVDLSNREARVEPDQAVAEAAAR